MPRGDETIGKVRAPIPRILPGAHDAVAAFTVIAAGAPFVSRGDKSGTDALKSAFGARP